MKRKTVPVSEVELIDLHPDNRLSETVRRIPFLNYTDSVANVAPLFSDKQLKFYTMLEIEEILNQQGEILQ